MPHTLHRFVILNESQIQETMNEVKTDIRNIFEQVAQQQRVSGLTDIKKLKQWMSKLVHIKR